MASNFWDLPYDTRVKLAENATLTGFGVTVPITTPTSRTNLLRAKEGVDQLYSAVRSVTWTGPVNFAGRGGSASVAQNTPIPQEVINLLSPYFAGYDLSGGNMAQLDSTVSGLQDAINRLFQNPSQIPPIGSGVTYDPNNTTPPAGTPTVAAINPLPVVTAPKTTTNPSNSNQGTSILETIAKTSLVVAGVAVASNIINNAISPSTTVVEPITSSTVDDDAIENEDPEPIDSDEDPGINTDDDFVDEDIQYRDPADVGEEEASPYGSDYQAKGEPVLGEDGTPSGFLRNPETGELYTEDGTQVGGVQGPASSSNPSSRGLFGAQADARTQASAQDQSNFALKEDWRVRLSLAPGANYLYKAPEVQGILAPLAATDGVIFPYTPNIQVGYSAAYDATMPTHSNYKIYQYTSSAVDNVSITCDFTAQDTFEANYLLAVIHFFRTLTKMFYGQDQNPKPGTPPPLVFLYGLGAFQFNAHPLVITNFNYNLPNDVDYIRAAVTTTLAGVNKSVENPRGTNTNTSGNRLGSGILPGGIVPPTTFGTVPGGTVEPTYVPTRMQIQISALPIVTRNQISNAFSLKDYASGKLLQGTKRAGGGIW